MRIFGLLLIGLFAGMVVWASSDLPLRGDPTSPSATGAAAYYIESAYADAHTPNMVTSVLADYRGFDTFGEAVVVVTAALSCLLILLRRREDEIEGEGDEGLPYPSDPKPEPDPSRVVKDETP